MLVINTTIEHLTENKIEHCDDFRDWFAVNHPYDGVQQAVVKCHDVDIASVAWDDNTPGMSWPVCNPAKDHPKLSVEEAAEVAKCHDIVTRFSPAMCRALKPEELFGTVKIKTMGSISHIYLDEEQETEFKRAMKYDQLGRIIPTLCKPVDNLHIRVYGTDNERIHSVSDIAQYK